MDENRLPIGIDSEVDNVFQVLFFIVTGEHGAYYFGILSEIIIPRRGAVLLIGGNPQWLCAMLFRIAG